MPREYGNHRPLAAFLLGHEPNFEGSANYSAPISKHSDYRTWLIETFHIANDRSRKLLALTIWSIWFARNRLIHEGIRKIINELSGSFQAIYMKLML